MTLIKSFESFKNQHEELIFVANPEAISIVESFLTESGEFFRGDVEKAISVLEANGFSSPEDFFVAPLNEAIGTVKYEGHESSPSGTEVFISINGHKYGYMEKPYDEQTDTGGIDAGDLARKFEKILQFSAANAVNWLRKNSKLTSGGKSTENKDAQSVKENDSHETDAAESPETSASHDHEMSRYMFFQNLKTIKSCIDKMMEMDPQEIDELINNGHDWAEDHLATSKDDIQEVCDWLCNNIK